MVSNLRFGRSNSNRSQYSATSAHIKTSFETRAEQRQHCASIENQTGIYQRLNQCPGLEERVVHFIMLTQHNEVIVVVCPFFKWYLLFRYLPILILNQYQHTLVNVNERHVMAEKKSAKQQIFQMHQCVCSVPSRHLWQSVPATTREYYS